MFEVQFHKEKEILNNDAKQQSLFYRKPTCVAEQANPLQQISGFSLCFSIGISTAIE
jgi:hypothetical protein